MTHLWTMTHNLRTAEIYSHHCRLFPLTELNEIICITATFRPTDYMFRNNVITKILGYFTNFYEICDFIYGFHI